MKKRDENQAFKFIWLPSKKLKYGDLSGRKMIQEQNPSTQKNLSKSVQSILDGRKHLMLVSEPMAGKTHFTIRYLQQLKGGYILIPNPNLFDSYFKLIPTAPKNAKYKIVLLDDLHDYVKGGSEKFIDFLTQVIDSRSDIMIWANNMSGPEFQIMLDNIPLKLQSRFEKIVIDSNMDINEAKRIRKAVMGDDNLPEYFDRNIGSIFEDLKQINFRYSQLDGASKILLRSIKELYLVGIYHSPFEMMKADIRRLFSFYEPGVAAETISQKLRELETMKFIHKSAEPLTINFDERYLRIVVEPHLEVKKFLATISSLFADNAASYTQAMQAVGTYEGAVRLYQEMLAKNIQPNIRPYAVLIRLADDTENGLYWLKELERRGLTANEFIYSALLRTTHGDLQKLEVLKSQMQLRQVPINERINEMIAARKFFASVVNYNNLINLAGNYTKVLELFEEMVQMNLKPDIFTYNTLINISPDYKAALTWYEKIETGKATVITYNSLIKISPDYKTALTWYEKIETGKATVIT
ncbi:MAG: pentatricopeptide repeat-containing protein, partial [Bacteroidota bacterium]